MKTKYLLIVFALLCFTTNVTFSQTYCTTPSYSSNSSMAKMLNSSYNLNEDSYCIKVYIHVIRQSNGLGGLSVATVNQAFQLLNQDYNPHNISFSWDGNIDYIDNTTYYNSPNSTIFNVNNHTDGVDIYLYDESVGGNGLANGVGESSEFFVTGSFWESPYQPLATSHVISHEMGHVLFLWHTHHGTFNEGGNDNPCPELVNGSNSDICGDYVEDTPADPHIQFNVDNNCNWLGSGTDQNGDSYNPDTENIMAYTWPQCMSYFTPLQGLRMRNAIATLPYLQQTLATCCVGETLDLYVKDSPDDDGTEPNTITENMWTSKDIWVRNENNSGLEHQNPEYKSNGEPNYIKVRVINRSCVASTGNETLAINWAKANTALAWPQHWDGTLTNSGGFPLGGELPDVSIPIIEPGEEAIVTIPWVVPNPDDYSDNDNPQHFCLLSRIYALDDPNTSPLTTNPNFMVRNNNNLAWRNLTIVDLAEEFTGGVVGVGNIFNQIKKYKFIFFLDDAETGKPLFEEAEITITMDDVLYNAWEAGGKLTNNTRKGRLENQVIITGDNASLENVIFPPNALGYLDLNFNFLTKEISEKTRYVYHVVEEKAENGEIIGGEEYLIKKSPRALFYANGGNDKEVDEGETITISAEDIQEPAIYNWYDSDGNLIYEGKNLTVSADVVDKYKLEVIALTDGFKDYAEVEVALKPSTLVSISPNPSSNNINVSYKLNNINSAYLMVMSFYGSNTSYNYILDTTTTQTNIDISDYPQGMYTVALVCDGEIIDAKTLVKD